ncbi:MAG TPA: 4Fe-4S binding protein, partial [Sinorhizobium sp.]|nr:4Fe-4S binding protein [Sinorhizobium sp.]
VEGGTVWPLEMAPPWWGLTNYPERNDVLTLLDGAILVLYILGTALVAGLAIAALLMVATLCLGRWNPARFHHLAQTLIPLAAAGVFLGLSTLTVIELRMDGIDLPFVREMRAALLLLASLWSCTLCWRVSGLYRRVIGRRLMSLLAVGLALAIADAGWFLFFWAW